MLLYHYLLLISVLDLEEWLIVRDGELGDDGARLKNTPVL